MKIVLIIIEAIILAGASWCIAFPIYLVSDEGELAITVGWVAAIAAFIFSIRLSKQGGGVFNFISRYFNLEEGAYDETAYSSAESEADSGTYDKGLWSKALVNAKGNEELRKTEYMKLRVKQLERKEKQ